MSTFALWVTVINSTLLILALYLMLTHFIAGAVAREVNRMMTEQDGRIRLLLALTNKVSDEDLSDLMNMLSHWRKTWKSPDGTAFTKKKSSSEEAKL